jgi:4-carboxymuconolactone decarboxylase
LYAKALDLLGSDGVVDLTGIVGYYSLIAATIKVFGIIPHESSAGLSMCLATSQAQ